ncbi:MAG: DUF1573 domain-containing protein [Planctomycetaceae bacterium]|nr:DUF1573 domain-containing protein [Planctomycetaceae bacterium]
MLLAALLAVQSVLLASTPAAPQAARPAAPQQAQPSPIVIQPPTVDLGAVQPGSVNPGKFLIVNRGSTPVRVLDAVPNCKCTAISDIKGKTIAPGAMLELSASLSAPRAPGEKEAVVFLTFEGAPPAQAKIKGDVRLPVVATPPYADALKENVRGTIKLRAADGKPFTVVRSGGKDPVFVGFDPKKDAPRAEYEVAWDLSGLACEQMPLWWFVFTDRTDCPVVPLRVRDECTGSKHDMPRFQRFWIVKESLVEAGNGMQGKPTEVDVDLEHYNPPKKGAVDRPDWREVKSVRSLTTDLQATLVSKKDVGADGCLVRIALVPTRSGAIEGELEITTATGTGRVPVTMFARTW